MRMVRLDSSVYAKRRARILDGMPDGSAMLLPTSPERVRSNDTHYPFRPASDFYYVTGFSEPEAWAVLRKGLEGPSYVLFVQPKDPEREVWTGIRTGVEGAQEVFLADAAFSIDDLDKELAELLAPAERLYFAFGRQPEVEGRVNTILNKLRAGRKAELGPAAIEDSAKFLSEYRLIKSKEELQVMREGARITGLAHCLAMDQARPGVFEYEIESLLAHTFRRHGANGWAYPSIVGGGANACILHYVDNNAAFGENDLVLIDAGAEVDRYATDVTRTFPVSGRFTPAQAELYQAVLEAQNAAIEAVKPGTTLQDIHDGVLRNLSSSMIELGLLSGSVDEILENAEYKRFYMHRTSHWLGLDVH
ncbi:MAG: aminopeptidase P N-terminal domain-containing protein, partial [Myxococcota bacterium]|nr:aminopeptidase P N-terminal domain-containing protein [Myxococcota bacterium]